MFKVLVFLLMVSELTGYRAAGFPSSPPPVNTVQSQSCEQKENSYWTGYRCACRVGYRENSLTGTCDPIDLVFPVRKPIIPTCTSTQFFNGLKCVCLPNHTRNNDGVCILSIPTCPANSQYLQGQCHCIDGYQMLNNVCVKKVQPCPPNMIKNALGQCVCAQGYYLSGGSCVLGEVCPLYSSRGADGKCVCNPGYHMNSQGLCTRCSDGAFWNGNSCIYLCAINEQYNPVSKQCECKEGYAYYQQKCSTCPSNYFVKDGYCVLCPINSEYVGDKCVCKSGYVLKNGICSSQCGNNQIYSQQHQQCRCLAGLGRVEGSCGVCPSGSSVNAVTQECSSCGANQVLVGSQCACVSGYGLNENAQCVQCESQGLILVEGVCASCPVNEVWDGSACICSPGLQQINGICTQKCGSGELSDPQGNCYTCPLNEVPLDGVCTCQVGYTRNALTNRCEISCKSNQFLVNGICAVCSLNSVYDATLGTCICPQGTYRNNFGYCEKYTPPPITCSDGEYFDDGNGCVACPAGCATCTPTACQSCTALGYKPSGNTCVANCGDGKIIYGVEQCDDGNSVGNDGCSSSCQVENSYTCNGEPSVCVSTVVIPTTMCGNGVIEAGEGCDDGGVTDLDGCSSSCAIQTGYICSGTPSSCTRAAQGLTLDRSVVNSGAIYVTVNTDLQKDPFIFNTPEQMKSFIKYKFPDHALPASAYCNQRVGALHYFDCFFPYPFGVPLTQFVLNLSYNYQGSIGYLDIPIDTNNMAFSMRSLL